MKVQAEKQRVRFCISDKLEILELITDKKMTIRQGNLIYIFCVICAYLGLYLYDVNNIFVFMSVYY